MIITVKISFELNSDVPVVPEVTFETLRRKISKALRNDEELQELIINMNIGVPTSKHLPNKARAKGGKARAAALTPDARTAIARRAAQARWAK